MSRLKVLEFLIAAALFSACSNSSSVVGEVSFLDTVSYDVLSHTACAYLNAKQDSFKQTYQLDSMDRWYYDEAPGTITFLIKGQKKLVVDYDAVGSVSTKTNTFLWAWDNPYTNDNVKSAVRAVWAYGEKRNFEKLKVPKWNATMIDGWDMTAIAGYLLHSKGCYRPPADSNLYLFMLIKDVRWMDSSYFKRKV